MNYRGARLPLKKRTIILLSPSYYKYHKEDLVFASTYSLPQLHFHLTFTSILAAEVR